MQPLENSTIRLWENEKDNKILVTSLIQYFGHLMWRVDSLEKTLMLGGIGGRRRSGRQRMRWLDGITDSKAESEWTPGVGDGQGGLECCDSWGRKELDTTEWLTWPELNWTSLKLFWSDRPLNGSQEFPGVLGAYFVSYWSRSEVITFLLPLGELCEKHFPTEMSIICLRTTGLSWLRM